MTGSMGHGDTISYVRFTHLSDLNLSMRDHFAFCSLLVLILGASPTVASASSLSATPYLVAQTEHTRVVEVEIRERQVVSPQEPIRAVEGEVLAIHWSGDEGVGVHLHGYDIEVQLRPPNSVVMTVDASVAGRFPIMSHAWAGGGQDHQTLIYLEVYPQ